MDSQHPKDSLDEFVCQICLELLSDMPEEAEAEEMEPVAGPSTHIKRPKLEAESVLFATKCGHVFHKICILNWLKTKQECPSCRVKATRATLRRIYLPLSSEGECTKCKDRVEEVNVMRGEWEESKKMLVGMEEIQEEMDLTQKALEGKLEEKNKEVEDMKRKLNEREKEVGDVRRILEDKNKKLEEINEMRKKMKRKLEMKVGEMEETQKKLEGELERERKEKEKLEETVEEMEMEQEVNLISHTGELKKMCLDFKMANDKMKEEFEKNKIVMRENTRKQMEDMQTSLENVTQENVQLKMVLEMAKEGEKRKMRDWKQMYKLCVMERDKARENGAYYEKWCKRLSGIPEDTPSDIVTLTEIMENKVKEVDTILGHNRSQVPSCNDNPPGQFSGSLLNVDHGNQGGQLQEQSNNVNLSASSGVTLDDFGAVAVVKHDLFLSSDDEDTSSSSSEEDSFSPSTSSSGDNMLIK